MVLTFQNYQNLTDDDAQKRIIIARKKLGKKVVLLCHHYQRADVYQHADLTGDSLKLSKLAAQTDAEFIVFCGVHFMAEVADMMSAENQVAILPDMAAGCSMADMANLAKVERAWHQLDNLLDVENTFTPVTYINSAADLKAFCGEHGGIVCTSSNAPIIAEWAFKQRPKILFFPDQHLGRWTGFKMGIPLDEMLVWNPDLPNGGLSESEIKKAKILLWDGHCSVHQMFQKSQIEAFRKKYPEGRVIAHPECNFDVCKASDFVGSTEFIVKTIKESDAPSRWLVGTELNLVERLAAEMKPLHKTIQFMATMVCMCSTMQRIDPQHLCWVLENLLQGNIVNAIHVNARDKALARKALDKMLAIS